ncbi:ORF45 [macacine gammaherpesvirus 12]|uniref:ORF45 n=1 Tax=macacine gammaherpesvirus 12 TaxID=2560571 RepID=A0A0B5CYF4_9GAMA|nr:ORF45 [Macaca nemestrina rhadinovirus 2]AJE29689.2 ORF45 [Macaca nemestrina rhadinovirus 2]
MAMFLSDPPRTPPATPRMLPIPGAPKKRTRRFLFAGAGTALPVPPGYQGPRVIDMSAPDSVFDLDSPPTTPKTPDETDSRSEDSNYDDSDVDEETNTEPPVSSPPKIGLALSEGDLFRPSNTRPSVIVESGPVAQPNAPAPLTAFGGPRPVAVVTGQHRAPPSSDSNSDDFFIDDYEDNDESDNDDETDGFSPRGSTGPWPGDVSRSPPEGDWSSDDDLTEETGAAAGEETIIISSSDDEDEDDQNSVGTEDEFDANAGSGGADVIDLCSSSDSDDEVDGAVGGARANCKRRASRLDDDSEDDIIYVGTTQGRKRRVTSTAKGGATSSSEGAGVSGRQNMAATPPVCGNDNYPWPWLD